MTDQNAPLEEVYAAQTQGEESSHNQRKRLTLEEILEGIPEGASLGEVDWGPPRGAEFW